MGKKLYKKFRYDYTNKGCMHESESVPEKEAQKISGIFEFLMDHLILARRPYLRVINKKKKIEFAV